MHVRVIHAVSQRRKGLLYLQGSEQEYGDDQWFTGIVARVRARKAARGRAGMDDPALELVMFQEILDSHEEFDLLHGFFYDLLLSKGEVALTAALLREIIDVFASYVTRIYGGAFNRQHVVHL